MSTRHPVVLTSTHTETQAILMVQMLERAGIAARIEGGLLSGMRAEAPGEVRILVDAADQTKALALLETMQKK